MSSASARVRAGARETTRSIELPRSVLGELERHAIESWPRECCGVLVGSIAAGDRVTVSLALPADNVSEDPSRAFTVAPEAILEAGKRARSQGLDLVGYYHSHPTGSAEPSAADREDAWPETSYVILGLEGRSVREVRSWRLDADGFAEERVEGGSIRS